MAGDFNQRTRVGLELIDKVATQLGVCAPQPSNGHHP